MLKLLNTTLDDLAAVVGFTATVRLAANYGGQDLNVPELAAPDHHLAKLIGFNRYKALCDSFGGDRLSVPTLLLVNRETSYATMLLLMSRDFSDLQIANMVNLGRRRVDQVRKEFKALGILGQNQK